MSMKLILPRSFSYHPPSGTMRAGRACSSQPRFCSNQGGNLRCVPSCSTASSTAKPGDRSQSRRGRLPARGSRWNESIDDQCFAESMVWTSFSSSLCGVQSTDASPTYHTTPLRIKSSEQSENVGLFKSRVASEQGRGEKSEKEAKEVTPCVICLNSCPSF